MQKQSTLKRRTNKVAEFYKTQVDINKIIQHFSPRQKQLLLKKLMNNLFKPTAEEYAEIAEVFGENRGNESEAAIAFDTISDQVNSKFLKVLKH